MGLSTSQLADLPRQLLFATDSPSPEFSWTVLHSDRGAVFSAFRMIVASDQNLTHVWWDSGAVWGESASVRYGGRPLESSRVYYWKAVWKDGEGVWSEWSEETGHFITGLLTPESWKDAKWIAAPASVTSAPLLSKKFPLEGSKVGMALLYLSGLGFSKTYVNGVDIHARSDPPIALSPGWTNYELRVPYTAHLVTDIVALSTQVGVSVVLGMGWRNRQDYPPKDPLPHPDTVPRVMRAVLRIMYLNGTSFDVFSDSSWSVEETGFAYDSIYNGETFDMFNARSNVRLSAVVTEGPTGVMYLPVIPPMVEIGVEKPQIIYHNASTYHQIVDFGNNSAGVCELNVTNVKAGYTIFLHHAEVRLHPPYGPANGSLYFDNLRTARQTDTYVSNGTTTLYQPSFTYHGFRYVKVTDYPRELTKSDIRKKVIASNLQLNGDFHTSDPLLNMIQENCVRGQRSNLMSVPTDCCQRDERLAWMGDAGLSADSMALNFHTNPFHPHFVQLIVDELTNGSLPDVTPFYRYGTRPADPSWGAAFPQILWVLYHYYGDLATVEKYFPVLTKYIDFMTQKVEESGIGRLYGYYGDWVPPPPHPKVNVSFTSAFSYLNNLRQAVQLADAINDTGNASRYKDLFQVQADNFNKAFLANNQYLSGLQVSYVLPLYLGIVPSDIEPMLVNNFLNQLQGSDQAHVTAGIIGAKFLLPVLTGLNRQDLAMEVAQQTSYPSWGFMIHNQYEPATTLWELWNSHNGSAGMDSRNHHMFSSISGWMKTDMVGLSQAPGTSGFRDIHFRPAPSLELSEASVSLQQPRLVAFSWRRSGGLQCGKVAEDRSKNRPGLPEHGGLFLSCEEEGEILKVEFASFGTPTGQCGFHREGSCHARNSREVVERFCLGKSECVVPSDADFWGNLCPGVESRWLTVTVQCGRESVPDYIYSSLTVDLRIPVGGRGTVFIPAYGKSGLQVRADDELVWERGSIVGVLEGLVSWEWVIEEDSLALELVSGDYSFTVTGGPPEQRKWVESWDGVVSVECEDGRAVSTVVWASYGDGTLKWAGQEAEFVRGSCHAGSSRMVVERECLGREKCEIHNSPAFFGGANCASRGHLSLVYTCNRRW